MRFSVFCSFCIFGMGTVPVQSATTELPTNPEYLPVYAQEVHGGVGLIQTPTARMNPDGEFSLNYQDVGEYRFWSTSLQLFPALETTIRYSDVRTRLYSDDPGFSGDQTLKDKGIDVKLRLWQESWWLPQMSVGFRDFGGTGLFESEYIAASKRFGDLDVHLGLGFGYLGRRANIQNPFCQVAERFCERPGGYGSNGSQVEYGKFFRGDAALFGGLSYQTPWQPLSLTLEYDANDYQRDRAGALEVNSPWNLGARYQYSKNLDLHLNYQRGNTFGFGLSYHFNFHRASQAKIVHPPRTVPAKRLQAGAEYNRLTVAQELYQSAAFATTAMAQVGDKMVIQGYPFGYRRPEEFLERAGKVLAKELPESIKTYELVEVVGGQPMVTTTIDADKFVAAARRDTLEATYEQSYQRQEPNVDAIDWQMRVVNPSWYTEVNSYWTQSFGGPENFYMYQGGLLLGSGYIFNPQWTVHGTARVDILTNFDEFKFTVDAFDSDVPRTRTYVREYAKHRAALENLFVSWKDKLATNWYGGVYAGALETMYSGVGGEVLYREVDSRFAWGVDLNYLKQRDFDKPLAVRDYSVVSGHVSAYWQPEFFDDVLLKVKAGRYLAKDLGVTFEFSRRFDSGIVVGAYAVKTNLSAEQYGEGSFTKGFYISLPFDLFTLRPATGRGRFPWVPLTRDGGQSLNRPLELFNFTDARSPFSR